MRCWKPDFNTGVRFSLEKYYVDFVSDEGLYFIGYSARLRFGGINLNYCATVHHPDMSGITTGPVLSAHNPPVTDDSALNWQCPELGFDGLWRPLNDATSLVLHETNSGSVKWNCQQPAAKARLRTTRWSSTSLAAIPSPSSAG